MGVGVFSWARYPCSEGNTFYSVAPSTTGVPRLSESAPPRRTLAEAYAYGPTVVLGGVAFS